MELKVKCIKCEMEIKRIDLEEDIEPKKGEYINDMACDNLFVNRATSEVQ